MSFAYIQEAWGAPPGEGKKKRRPPTPEQFDQMDDRYLYTRRQPKERTYKPAMIEESRGNVYDVTPDDLYGPQGMRSGSPSTFMDYDDFYKSDFQYTSAVDDGGDAFTPLPQTQHLPPRQEAMIQAPQRISVLPQEQLRESFANDSHGASSMNACTREQMYLELVLYTVTGIFLILILEQFLQLGSKMP